MKKHLLIILSLIFTHSVHSQIEKKPQQRADLISDQQDTALLITNINKTKEEIKNNIGNYQKTENMNDSTGYRYVYRKDKELKLILIDYKDSRYDNRYIDRKVEWYFESGRLIYCEQTWTDILPNKVVDNQKMYLDEKHLVAWIKFGNKPVDASSDEFKKTETDILATELN